MSKKHYMNYGDFRYKINLGYDKRKEDAEDLRKVLT